MCRPQAPAGKGAQRLAVRVVDAMPRLQVCLLSHSALTACKMHRAGLLVQDHGWPEALCRLRPRHAR